MNSILLFALILFGIFFSISKSRLSLEFLRNLLIALVIQICNRIIVVAARRLERQPSFLEVVDDLQFVQLGDAPEVFVLLFIQVFLSVFAYIIIDSFVVLL